MASGTATEDDSPADRPGDGARSFIASVGSIVFGMEDGTVSIFGPVFGVATAAPDSHAVLLAGAQAGFVLLDGGPGNPWGQPGANLRRRVKNRRPSRQSMAAIPGCYITAVGERTGTCDPGTTSICNRGPGRLKSVVIDSPGYSGTGSVSDDQAHALFGQTMGYVPAAAGAWRAARRRLPRFGRRAAPGQAAWSRTECRVPPVWRSSMPYTICETP